MRSGQLSGTDAEHPASGNVMVSGNTIGLEDVKITEAPDARVILAKDFAEPTGVRCGPLSAFVGSHEYEIPAGTNVDEFNSVVIWCDEFSVPIGKATLSA